MSFQSYNELPDVINERLNAQEMLNVRREIQEQIVSFTDEQRKSFFSILEDIELQRSPVKDLLAMLQEKIPLDPDRAKKVALKLWSEYFFMVQDYYGSCIELIHTHGGNSAASAEKAASFLHPHRQLKKFILSTLYEFSPERSEEYQYELIDQLIERVLEKERKREVAEHFTLFFQSKGIGDSDAGKLADAVELLVLSGAFSPQHALYYLDLADNVINARPFVEISAIEVPKIGEKKSNQEEYMRELKNAFDQLPSHIKDVFLSEEAQRKMKIYSEQYPSFEIIFMRAAIKDIQFKDIALLLNTEYHLGPEKSSALRDEIVKTFFEPVMWYYTGAPQPESEQSKETGSKMPAESAPQPESSGPPEEKEIKSSDESVLKPNEEQKENHESETAATVTPLPEQEKKTIETHIAAPSVKPEAVEQTATAEQPLSQPAPQDKQEKAEKKMPQKQHIVPEPPKPQPEIVPAPVKQAEPEKSKQQQASELQQASIKQAASKKPEPQSAPLSTPLKREEPEQQKLPPKPELSPALQKQATFQEPAKQEKLAKQEKEKEGLSEDAKKNEYRHAESYEELADEVMQKCNTSLNEDCASRVRRALITRIRNIRTNIETREKLVSEMAQGGCGITGEQAECLTKESALLADRIQKKLLIVGTPPPLPPLKPFPQPLPPPPPPPEPEAQPEPTARLSLPLKESITQPVEPLPKPEAPVVLPPIPADVSIIEEPPKPVVLQKPAEPPKEVEPQKPPPPSPPSPPSPPPPPLPVPPPPKPIELSKPPSPPIKIPLPPKPPLPPSKPVELQKPAEPPKEAEKLPPPLPPKPVESPQPPPPPKPVKFAKPPLPKPSPQKPVIAQEKAPAGLAIEEVDGIPTLVEKPATPLQSAAQVPARSVAKPVEPLPLKVEVKRTQTESLHEKKLTVADVKKAPHLVGPIEELYSFTLKDFRRISANPVQAANRIFDKIQNMEKESMTKKMEAIDAWKKSDVNQLYVQIGKESFGRGTPIAQAIEQRKNAGQEYLTEAEFDALLDLSTMLRH